MSYAYYRFFPGDYMRDTMHLGWLEDMAYRRLIDLYCLHGKPIRNDLAYIRRACRATEPEQQAALDVVLAEFFQLKADGWHQTRCDAELKYRGGLSKAGSAGAKARWNKEEEKPVRNNELHAVAMPSQCGAIANQNQNQNQNHIKPKSNPLAPRVNTLSLGDGAISEKIPVVGGAEFEIRHSYAAELERLFPAVDVPQTLREIRAWNIANPERRKTPRGVAKHITNWMQKVQNG